jgi:glycosyltransferase involved in cell wall biosynthesis
MISPLLTSWSARCVYSAGRMRPNEMLKKIARELLRVAAIVVLGAVYGAAARLCRSLDRRGQGSWRRSGCILVIGTFHNPNWFHSHIRPLVRSGIGDVILVCDEVVEPANGVCFECPPRWLATLLSRAAAKFLWAIRCGFRYRPDLYMGYHIFPAAVMALVLARLFGRPACYQDTSGSLELEGGGWQMDNRILAALQRPSAYVERLVIGMVREFDSVVVRGSGAEAYIRDIGYRGTLAVITGSVEAPVAWRDFSQRTIDLAFVGRLMEDKRPDRFIAVAAALAKERARMRAVVIGDGPQSEALKSLVRELGIEANVEFLGKREDVVDLLALSRVFVLPSRSEGVSIAMLEAMAAGAVPVVANVGDLADFVQSDVTGFIVAQDDIAGYTQAALRLLSSEDLWRRCSTRSRASAVARSGIDAIEKRWNHHLKAVMAKRRASAGVAYANQGNDADLR